MKMLRDIEHICDMRALKKSISPSNLKNTHFLISYSSLLHHTMPERRHKIFMFQNSTKWLGRGSRIRSNLVLVHHYCSTESRTCNIDFETTTKNGHAMTIENAPRISYEEEGIQPIGKAPSFSSIEVCLGYWPIQIEKRDCNKTTIMSKSLNVL